MLNLRLGNKRQCDAQSCPPEDIAAYRLRGFTESIPRPLVGLNHLHMLLYKHRPQV